MWWRTPVGLGIVLLGCTAPNRLYGYGAPADGGHLPDATALELGAEGPAPDQASQETNGETGGAVEPPAVDAAVVDTSPVSDTGLEAVGPLDSRPPDLAMPTSLIGYWKLDETAGTTAVDSSGNGHDGTLESLTAAAWTQTPRGGGLAFTRGLTSGVRVGNVNAVPPKIQALTRFTIAAWTFRGTQNTGQHQTVMSRQRIGNTEIFSLALDNDLAKLYVYPEQPGNTLEATGTLTTGASGGAWVHVAATYDGVRLRVYVNGVPGSGPLDYTGALTASQLPLYIGTNKNDPSENQPFDGILDEVLLFSEALSVDAIARVRDGNLAGL